ncbi:MAG: hypothetical protein ACLSGF_06360 [Alistipes onderdonkii]
MKYETLAWLSSFRVPKSAYQKIGAIFDFAPSIYSDRYVEPGDYVKLDNLTIGYTFDLPQRNKVIRSIRVFCCGHEPAYDQRLFWAGPRSGDRRPHTRRGPGSTSTPTCVRTSSGASFQLLMIKTMKRKTIHLLRRMRTSAGFMHESRSGTYSDKDNRQDSGGQ